MNPTAAGPQPKVTTAKAMTNEKLGIVRLSMGTLKLASMVEDLSDNRSSRWRSRVMGSGPAVGVPPKGWARSFAALEFVEVQKCLGDHQPGPPR